MPTNAERRKLLLKLVPEGMPVTRQWLMEQHPAFDRHAIDNLLKSDQLSALAPGVYLRPETELSWQAVVACVQNVMKLKLYVGGLTALELQGFAHYLPLGSKRAVYLYGQDRLPQWVSGALPQVRFVRQPPLRALGTAGLVHADGSPPHEQAGLQAFLMSTVERAFLEVLMDVPDKQSFEHADQLLQGMTTLSPRRLETLLRNCQNVKVRRLFYWLAERHRHAWFSRLTRPENLDELGLGSGNRLLARHGKLDSRYKITVPEEMWTPATNTSGKSGS